MPWGCSYHLTLSPGSLTPNRAAPEFLLFSFIQQMGQAVLNLPFLIRDLDHLEESLNSSRETKQYTDSPCPKGSA